MDWQLQSRLDDLINVIDADSRIREITKLKAKLTNNNQIVSEIDKINEFDIYSEQFKNSKKELYNNSDYVKYQKLENEIHFLILDINSRLNRLTDGRRCS